MLAASGMPRKIQLTPLQRDILWLLEEAGEETLGCAIASVQPFDRAAFDRAVEGLVRLGHVIRSDEEPGGSLLLTNVGRRALTT